MMKKIIPLLVPIMFLGANLGILSFLTQNTFSNEIILYINDFDDVFGDITVLEPSSSDIIIIGEKYNIKWDSKGGIEQVSIGLFQRSEFVESISLVTINDGSYEWDVGFYNEASDYSIGIWDYNDFNCGDLSDYFMIALNKPFSVDFFVIIALIIGLSSGSLLGYYFFRFFSLKRKIHQSIF